MKRYIICIPLFFKGLLLYSQTPQTPVIQSPNAASLGIFGSVPVNHYTGVPDISIPLYTLQTGNITVPITLQYHPGNVKPNEYPGWVGLGWNLQSYGTITRVRNGNVDENDFLVPSYYDTGKNLLNNSTWDTYTKLLEYFQNPLNADADADEFYFSFMGYSGKFFYTYNGWMVDSEHNIKVEFEPVDGFLSNSDIKNSLKNPEGNYYIQTIHMCQSRMFKRFTLITDDGTKYVFGGEDAIEYYSIYDDALCNYVTANTWYLKKIIDTDNNEVMFYYHRGYPACKLSFTGLYYNSSCLWEGGYAFHISPTDTLRHTGQIMFPVYLSSIVGANDYISFITSISTQKMYSPNYLDYKCPPPTCIKITFPNLNIPDKDSRDRGFKWEQLDVMRICYRTGNSKLNYTLQFSNSTSERLTLKKLSAPGGRTYTFSYNIQDFPDYGGDKTDHWGYFNNQSFHNTNIPDLDNKRNTNANVVTNGLLNKIKYPTGGYTEFDWEAHYYSQIVSTDRQSVVSVTGYAGGSRIKEIRSYAASGAVPIKKKYHYVLGYNGSNLSSCSSSGVLNGKPQYLFKIIDRPLSTNQSIMMSYTNGIAHGLQSFSYNAMGSYIGYSEVIEMQEDNSFTKYVFTNYDVDMHNVSHFDKTGGYLGWISSDVYRPTSNLDRERGKPLAEYSYDNSNKLLKSVVWEYTTETSRFDKYNKRVEMRDHIDCSYGHLIFAAAIKEFSYRYNVVSKETKEYDTNGLNPVTTSETYTYNDFDQLSCVTTSRSDGTTSSVTFKYPGDLPNTPYTTMTGKNILAPVIESETSFINGVTTMVTDAEHNQYKAFNGIYKPELIKKLETLAPITVGTPYASQMKEVVSFDYNNNGRMIKLQPKDGPTTVYLWGYKEQYLIAKIENAAYNDVAYTSFEDDYGGSNWTLNSLSGSVSTTNKRTGEKSFTLAAGSIAKTGLTSGKAYILSYWSQNGSLTLGTLKTGNKINGWTYYEHTFTASSSTLNISGNGKNIDDLCLYPVGALITTYTYKPLAGITSETDPSGRTIFYEYDNFGRLKRVKDEQGNILKEYRYHYAQ